MDAEQVTAEQGAGWVYRRFIWLFFPYLMIYVFLSALLGEQAIAVLFSSVIFVALVSGLKSPYLYVKRHTQQALILAAAVTAGMLLVAVLESICLGFPGVAILWFGGGYWGLRQVKRGECWLMENRDEGARLPRPWETAEEEILEEDVGGLLEAFRNGTWEEREIVAGRLEALGEVEMF